MGTTKAKKVKKIGDSIHNSHEHIINDMPFPVFIQELTKGNPFVGSYVTDIDLLTEFMANRSIFKWMELAHNLSTHPFCASPLYPKIINQEYCNENSVKTLVRGIREKITKEKSPMLLLDWIYESWNKPYHDITLNDFDSLIQYYQAIPNNNPIKERCAQRLIYCVSNMMHQMNHEAFHSSYWNKKTILEATERAIYSLIETGFHRVLFNFIGSQLTANPKYLEYAKQDLFTSDGIPKITTPSISAQYYAYYILYTARALSITAKSLIDIAVEMNSLYKTDISLQKSLHYIAQHPDCNAAYDIILSSPHKIVPDSYIDYIKNTQLLERLENDRKKQKEAEQQKIEIDRRVQQELEQKKANHRCFNFSNKVDYKL